MTGSRGQANVIGVALLLGIAVVSLGALTASVGVIVDSNAAEADATRVAADLDEALEPVAATGAQRGTVSFTDGTLSTVERHAEVRANGEVVESVQVDALVFETTDQRVAFHAGAIVRGEMDNAWMETPPRVTVDEDVVIVSLAKLDGDPTTVSGDGGVRTTLETDVSHDRRELGNESFSFAIETSAPDAWARHFREQGATVDIEAGEPPVVVATFEGEKTGYLVVHDLSLEVTHG